jgi:hypothetical protein
VGEVQIDIAKKFGEHMTQSILGSGESGAGKTVASHNQVQYLMSELPENDTTVMVRGIVLIEIIWKLYTKIINDRLLGNVKFHERRPTTMHDPRTRYRHGCDRNQTSESGRNDEIGLAAGKDIGNSLAHASFCKQ